MENRIWVLGAATPEMEAIEARLRECGERIAYAGAPDTDLSGAPATQEAPVPRVHPNDAYRATRALAPARRAHGECTILASAEHGSWIGDGCTTIYLVECGVDVPGYEPPAWEDQSHAVCVVRIGRDRPGDPGFGRPPASTLGQVVAELAQIGTSRARRVDV